MLCIKVDDVFHTGGWYEVIGQSKYNSVERIIQHLRAEYPDGTISGTITTTEVI